VGNSVIAEPTDVDTGVPADVTERAGRSPTRPPSRRVLVLGREDRSVLAVVRSLGRYGIDVHLAWCPQHALARHSRYVSAVHNVPPYAADGRWLAALEALAREHQYDLIIPCDDRSLIPLHLHRGEIAGLGSVNLPNEQAFRVLFDKFQTGQLARSLGISVPHERIIDSLEALDRVLPEFSFPVILKPPRSYNLDNFSQRHRVKRVYDAQTLRTTIEPMLRHGTVLLQENFVGTGAGVEVLVSGGEILLAFQHVRVHEKFGGGGSSYRRSSALTPDLLDATTRLMRALHYSGVAMVEFKVAPDGRWILVEVNARFWGSLPLAVGAGADFPAALYQMLVEGRREFRRQYREGVYCRNLLTDLVWMAKNLKTDRSDPNTGALPIRTVLAEFGNVVTLREYSDTFTRDDLRPAIADVSRAVSGIWNRAWSGARIAVQSLGPVRMRVRADAERALRNATTVLFVCKGNICRSPFADAVAREAFPATVRVRSAGYFPTSGRPSPQEARTAAREFGVDLDAHRSNGLDAQTIADADVIFVFDDEDRRAVLARDNTARRKIHHLGVFSPAATPIIADPYGGDVDRFRETYQAIARSIRTSAASSFAAPETDE
jgi:protein-tyrosine-phosphatase/predicted ATP-grasp superfamily ATP-dependent carboligase